MLVPDRERSERFQQRRKNAGGRLLHCCCICGHLAPWNGDWSAYYSVKDIDDGMAIPKFCSAECRARGGPNARDVSEEMRAKAKAAEWRLPETVYREATAKEKYREAVYQQRGRKALSPPTE